MMTMSHDPGFETLDTMASRWLEDMASRQGHAAAAAVFDGEDWRVRLGEGPRWGLALLAAAAFLESGQRMQWASAWKDLAYALMHRVRFPEGGRSDSLPVHRAVYREALEMNEGEGPDSETYRSVSPGSVMDNGRRVSAVRVDLRVKTSGTLENTGITRVKPFEAWQGEMGYWLASLPLDGTSREEGARGRLSDAFGQSIPRVHVVASSDEEAFGRDAVFRLSEAVGEALDEKSREAYDEMWKTGLWTWLSFSERDETMESLATFLAMEVKSSR